MYDLKTGKKQTPRNGQPMRRITGVPLPCGTCPKGQPDAQPHPEKELTEQSWQAYRYVQDAEADPAGLFIPRDRVVIRNMALVRSVREQIERDHAAMMESTLAAMMAPGAGSWKGR
jgi:hypothetical protein